MSSAALSTAIRTDWHRVLRTLWNESKPISNGVSELYFLDPPTWVITREPCEEGDRYSVYWGARAVCDDKKESRMLPDVANRAWKSADVITATVPGYDNRAVMFRVDEDGETWQTRGGATFAADVLEDVKEIPL